MDGFTDVNTVSNKFIRLLTELFWQILPTIRTQNV